MFDLTQIDGLSNDQINNLLMKIWQIYEDHHGADLKSEYMQHAILCEVLFYATDRWTQHLAEAEHVVLVAFKYGHSLYYDDDDSHSVEDKALGWIHTQFAEMGAH